MAEKWQLCALEKDRLKTMSVEENPMQIDERCAVHLRCHLLPHVVREIPPMTTAFPPVLNIHKKAQIPCGLLYDSGKPDSFLLNHC